MRVQEVFENNRRWAAERSAADPDFFPRLAAGQSPQFLWIGCSDSRVATGQITGLGPGEVFVHRNIANIVNPTDMNTLSVLQYAVEVLKVTDVIVCGHYGCGGVAASIEDKPHGLIDNWLEPIRAVYNEERARLDAVEDERARLELLCELNVARQVSNVCESTFVQAAWERGQEVRVHGWIYGLSDGLLQDLDLTVSGPA